MSIRGLFICLMLSFVAVAQVPSHIPAPSPSEKELNSELDMGSEGVNTQTQELSSPPSAWRALGSLVFVLAIAGGGVWALRKWGIKRLPGSGGTRIKVEETLALGERRFISIVKVDEEHFLIASHPQGVSFLARLDGSAEPGFGRQLEQQIQFQTPIPVSEMEAHLRGEQP
ncbi:MAG: flagellar biosynthetic protein FliO [Holophagaceae bacterium]|nr:flagellar biosynthetic protein FliO [Holophagaceae bacterium]